jgi:chemotaxis protein CheZ
MQAVTGEACGRLDELVEAAVRRAMAPLVDELRAFVDRRLGEVSAEINAAVRIVDVSEATLSGQLAGIQDQVARVLAAPDAEARNSGLELQSILTQTESAAHRILEAAEAISRCIGNTGAADATIRDKLATIVSACGFQDLAGQRIRRAIDHLQLVEGHIAVLASNGSGAPLPVLSADAATGTELAQGEIDKLLD